MRHSGQPTVPAPGDLYLRPWLPADASVVIIAYSDPEIQRWHRRRIASEAEARGLIEDWNACWQAETDGYWAIARTGSGAALGRVSLRDVDLHGGLAECSYWVLPSARGRGIATRAVKGLSRWALNAFGLHRLELAHSVANTASCHVAAKAGYRFEGTKRSALLHPDGWHDMHIHARIHGDHEAATR